MAEVQRPQPYIGVSGIGHHEQHLALFDIALRERIDLLGHFMMIGVQATSKSQVLDKPTRRGQMWHPVGDSIADAASNEDSGITKPYIHCAFEGNLANGISRVMRRTRHYTQGVQFNGLPWVDKDYRPDLNRFNEDYPGQDTVIQVHRSILDQHTPGRVATELATMPVDYLLFDASGGDGVALDADRLRPYIDEIYQRQLPIGVVVSGGLEADNMEELFAPLAEKYPSLSCDAEGRLRKGPEGSTELDMEAAESFILAWKNIVS